MKRCAARHGVILAMLAMAGCAAPAGNGTGVLRRDTQAGHGTRISSYVRVNERCEAAGLPTAAVTAAPVHGTLVARPARVVVGGRRFSGTTDCRNRDVDGIELWYQPAEGFRGTDAMAFQVDDGGGPLPFRATVDVR